MASFTITPDPIFSPTQGSSQFGVLADNPVYSVVTNSGTASAEDALNAIRAQFPTNSSHPTFSNLTVVAHTPLTVGTSPLTLWKFQVNYVQTESGSVPPDVTTDLGLLDTPPRVESIDEDFYQEPCYTDKYGDPIMNSAGFIADPAGYVERTRIRLTISVYLEGFDADYLLPFVGMLNNAPTVIPGIGFCETRTARVLAIRPVSGFSPYLFVAATTSGTATHGDLLEWDSEYYGYFGALTTVGSNSGFTIINASGGVNAGDVISDTNTSSSFSATVTLTANNPPIKTLFVLEQRATGFDYEDADTGQMAYFNFTVPGIKAPTQIFDHGVRCGADVPLRFGAPSLNAINTSITASSYTPAPGLIGNWDTSSDQLSARVIAGHVNRTQNGFIDLLTFKRQPDTSFTGLPF